MKKTLAILVFIGVQFSFAQAWVEKNARWYYTYEDAFGYAGVIQIKLIGDTILDGHNAQKLQTTYYNFNAQGSSLEFIDSVIESDLNFVHFFDSKVMQWDQNVWRTLYDFSGNSSYLTKVGNPANLACDDSTMVNSTSISAIILGGNSYSNYKISTNGLSQYGINGNANERFGNISNSEIDGFLFPVQKMCSVGIPEEPLFFTFECFQDSLLTYPSGVGCGNYSSFLGLPDFSVARISIFPNPTKESIQIELKNWNSSLLRFEIYNLEGRSIQDGSLSEENCIINVSTISRGWYSLCISSTNGEKSWFKLLKEE